MQLLLLHALSRIAIALVQRGDALSLLLLLLPVVIKTTIFLAVNLHFLTILIVNELPDEHFILLLQNLLQDNELSVAELVEHRFEHVPRILVAEGN